MRAEQACRFRLDEGYCVFAKSPDLQPSQEDALGNIFNSTMNNIFPQVGDSILSCAMEGNDVFLARNTLRTDIHGRKTMFTHAYAFSAEDYAQVMCNDPMAVLGVDMAALLESQSEGAQMPAVELSAQGKAAPDLQALFEKYNLNDKVRYGRLLLGAYQAMSSDSSLQLVTGLGLDETAPMVQELILCILEGMLPMLKGKLTFSSGPDTRMKISVVSTRNNSAPSGELLFGVEDDRYTNLRPRDEVTELAFYTLAALPHEARVRRAAEMEQWLRGNVDIESARLSNTLVAMAYCLSSDMEMNTDTLLMLYRSVTGAKNIPTDTANQLLTDLVRKLREGDGCNQKALSLIAGRYLRDSSAAFRAEADLALSVAPVDICVALAEAAFDQTMSDNVRQFLKTLLRRIPNDCELISDALRSKTVLWLLEENDPEFIPYATALMVSYQGTQKRELAVGILSSSAGRSFTEAEDAVLANCLITLADSGYALSTADTALLDEKCEQFSESLAKNAVTHLFKVRLAKASAEAGLQLILQLEAKYPQFFQKVYAVLSTGEAPEVWELYQTQACFTEDMDIFAVEKALREHNTFHNPCGPFEQAAAQRWLTMAEAEFAIEKDRSQMSFLIDPVSRRWFENTDVLTMSDAMKAELCTKIAQIFWETVTLDQIYQNETMINERLVVELPDTTEKLLLAFCCLALREDPKNPEELQKRIQDPETEEAFRKTLCECARQMIFVLQKEKKFLSWDLILLSCWQMGEKENGPDLKLLAERCAKLDGYFEAQGIEPQIEVDCSKLLADEKLKKTLCRQNIPGKLYGMLVEAIKPERGGFLGGLFGKKKEEEKPEQEEKPQRRGLFEKEEAPKKRGLFERDEKTGKRKNAFDPTDLDQM